MPIGGPPMGIPIGGRMGGGGPPIRPMGPPGPPGPNRGPLSSPSYPPRGGPPKSLRGLPLGSRIFVQLPMWVVANSPGGVLATI